MERLKEYILSLDPSVFDVDKIQKPKIEKLATGCYNENYILQIDSKRYIIRINNDDSGKGNLYNEYKTLKILDGFHAPKPVYFEKGMLIESFCNGKKIKTLTDDILKNIAKIQTKYIFLMITFFREITEIY
ncbi:MAG: hypothetical protein ACQEP1_01555 [Nanobdellota archaeon]